MRSGQFRAIFAGDLASYLLLNNLRFQIPSRTHLAETRKNDVVVLDFQPHCVIPSLVQLAVYRVKT